MSSGFSEEEPPKSATSQCESHYNALAREVYN